MNKVILMGRLTGDPVITRMQDGKAVARYTLAVDRRSKDNVADFISCVAFDRKGEFAEQYLKKGIKIAITGRLQTGKYTNKQGQTVYTTDVIIEDQEFAESKKAQEQESEQPALQSTGFVEIPADISKELPFT